MYIKVPTTHHTQQGVGLIEVLVALLVLAVGVMGYATMQNRALKGSDDALSRTKALSLSRDITERIRNNSVAPAVVQKYENSMNASTTPTKDACANDATKICDSDAMVKNDVHHIKSTAKEDGLAVAMAGCPGNVTGLNRSCVIVAWGSTKAAFSGDDKCMDSSGKYIQDSQCIVMEAF